MKETKDAMAMLADAMSAQTKLLAQIKNRGASTGNAASRALRKNLKVLSPEMWSDIPAMIERFQEFEAFHDKGNYLEAATTAKSFISDAEIKQVIGEAIADSEINGILTHDEPMQEHLREAAAWHQQSHAYDERHDPRDIQRSR